MTSRTFQVIAKLLCNLIDISISHEYASILPNKSNESWFLVSCAIPPEVYKYSEAVVRLGGRRKEIERFRGERRSSKDLRARS